MGANAYYYLAPIGSHPGVDRLWIVRSEKIGRGEIPNGAYILLPTTYKPWRFVQMLWHALRLGRRPAVGAFISINPFPYGVIQMIAATMYGKPIHFGFVGSDWYRHVRNWYGPMLRPFLRRADFITATGPAMRREMIAYGLDPQKIAILPHAIDLENYPVAEPEMATYDFIFVGHLIRRKRVDLILAAFAGVLEKHPDARLCIVGDGPLRAELEAQAGALGIGHAVDFAGFVKNVQPFLARSRIDIIASDMEGMPFSLIEGMASGLVPVSTPVGTIEDWIVDGGTGLLFPTGDAEALARQLLRLLDEPGLYGRLRENVLAMREQFSFAHATAVWNVWFSRLESRTGRHDDRE